MPFRTLHSSFMTGNAQVQLVGKHVTGREEGEKGHGVAHLAGKPSQKLQRHVSMRCRRACLASDARRLF